MDLPVQMLQMIEHSRLAIAIAQSNWLFPAIETIHVLSLTLTIGTVLIVDLRILGLAWASRPYSAVRRDILPLTWIAFGVAAVSGLLLFISQF